MPTLVISGFLQKKKENGKTLYSVTMTRFKKNLTFWLQQGQLRSFNWNTSANNQKKALDRLK